MRVRPRLDLTVVTGFLGSGKTTLLRRALGREGSTGIALIVSLLARARKSKRRLLACGLSQHYVEIFQITRLVDFMSVFPDEASALSENPKSIITPREK